MYKRWRLFGFAGAAIAAGITVGVVAAVVLEPGSSGAQDPGNGTTVVAGNPNLSNAALKDAGAKLGFAAKIPTRFPTSATRLQLVNTSVGPTGNGMPMLNLVFAGKPFEAKGLKFDSTLEMFQLNVRLLSPNGSLLAQDVAGYDLYKDVVDSDDVHGPINVTYMALRDGETLVMDFTGEQPTLEGMRDMLASLVVVK